VTQNELQFAEGRVLDGSNATKVENFFEKCFVAVFWG